MRPTSTHLRTMNLADGFRFMLISAVLTLLIFACSVPGGGGGGGGDTTPPALSSTIPLDGSLSVDNNTTNTLVLTFSENVTIGSGNITVYEGGGALFDAIGAAGLTGGGSTVITAPLSKSLRGDSPYYVQIDATLFSDAATNAYPGISDDTTWNFATAPDTAAPLLVSTQPADGATNVPTSLPSLRLTFNEDVTIGSGNIVIYNSLGTPIATIGAGSLTGNNTKTITAPFPETFTDGTSYYVNIDGTLFCDYASSPNCYAGIPDTTTWNFTAVADSQAPALVSTAPADEATNVSRTIANLTMTFDEPVFINAGNVTIYRADTTVFTTIPAGSLTANGATVTIPIGATLESGKSYYVQVDSGLIRDKVNNPYAGIADNTTWNFTASIDTVAPSVSSVTPVSGGMSASNPLAVQIDWSEDVTGFDEADITPTLYNCTIQALSWTAVSGSRYTFNLVPTSEAAYGFQIDPGVCTDLALNPSTGTTAWSHTYNLAPVVGSFDMTDGSDSGSSSSDDITNVTTPAFTGTTSKNGTLEIVSSVNGVVYTGTVAAGAWGPVTVSALTSSGLTGTVHSMTARVTDSKSVTGTSSALSVTIDVTAPTAGQPDLDAASDLGASSSDNVTSDDTPAFSGTANEGGTLDLRNDGSGIVYSGSISGDWTNRSVSALSGAGQTGTDHLIDARATDAAGNVGGWSSAVTVRIDTTAPTVGSLDMTDGSDSGGSNSDDITNVTTPAFTGTTNENGAFAILSDVSGSVYTGSVTSGSWGPFTVSALDATGQAGRAHTITARVTDLAGNDGTAALAVTIDTTGPVVGRPDLDTASDSGSSLFDNITNVTVPSFSGTSNEGGALTLRSSVDGTIYTGSITGDWSGRTSTVTLNSAGQTGRQHDVDAQAMDVAGNTGSWSPALTIWIDTTAPTVTVEQGSTQTDPTRNSPISFDATFVESVYDFATGDVSFTGSTAGGTLAGAVGGSGASYTVAVTGMTSSGTVIASLAGGVARDTAGNPSAASSSSDNSVTWYTVGIISAWSSSTTGTINNLAKPAGNNRLLLVFAGNRRSNFGARTVSSITWGGRTLTYLGETSNGANPSLTNSVYYLNEAGIAAATAPSNLVVTWSGAPTAQQEWAVFLQNVNQTTPFANLQQGASTTTNVTSAAVNYGMCDMGFITVSSITTAAGAYTINTSGFTLAVDQSASAIWDMLVGHQTFYASGSFTPDATRATSNKQRLQGFIIQVY